MNERPPPGALKLHLQYDMGMVHVSPRPEEGRFGLGLASRLVGNNGEVALNRSELAALHAAIGEMLDFYRSAP